MDVAVMGFGVVGSGVVELFSNNHESIVSKSTQTQLDLKYILDIKDFPDSPYKDKMIKDFNIILNDPDVGIVVETMGGLNPAYEFVVACLKAKKSVVSSNKELVAAKGYELLKTADENNVNFLFEASVGGGIPIIRPISQCLAANKINEIAGILNGTTNFILTKMISDNMSFEDALRLAQDNGYAEKDPSADIEGTDSCRKICILASLAFGKHVYPDEVYTQGIKNISLEDIEYARSFGSAIKLIGMARQISQDKIYALVSPAIVKNSSQLARVEDVFNAILVRSDATGDVVFYGKGAGKMPTASAVVADVIDCAKHTVTKKLFGWNDSSPNYVEDYTLMKTSLYVRGKTEDKSKASKEVSKLFGDIILLARNEAFENEIAFITPEASEKELREKLSQLKEMETINTIRITNY